MKSDDHVFTQHASQIIIDIIFGDVYYGNNVHDNRFIPRSSFNPIFRLKTS